MRERLDERRRRAPSNVVLEDVDVDLLVQVVALAPAPPSSVTSTWPGTPWPPSSPIASIAATEPLLVLQRARGGVRARPYEPATFALARDPPQTELAWDV